MQKSNTLEMSEFISNNKIVAKVSSENNIHRFKTFGWNYINGFNLPPIPLDEC